MPTCDLAKSLTQQACSLGYLFFANDHYGAARSVLHHPRRTRYAANGLGDVKPMIDPLSAGFERQLP